MSQIKVNTINDASGGESAKLYGVSMRYGGTNFVNRIINGAMVIDQRNTGASFTPSDNQYTLDRWVGRCTQTSKYTVQQNAGAVTPPAGFTNYLGVTSSSAYSVGSGDTFDIQQRIEGFNAADLGWGTANARAVTLSFWVRSSLTGTFGGVVQNSAFSRSYPYSYTISSANTWTYVSINVPGDTAGTWLTTNGTGIVVSFGLGNGSNYSGTAGAWVGAGLLNATGATSVVGTSGATFYITGVQLEAGSVATPFERRDYGRELIMCQRYYEKSSGYGTGNAYFVYGNRGGDGVVLAMVPFKTTKRAFATMTYESFVLTFTNQRADADAAYAIAYGSAAISAGLNFIASAEL